MTNRKKRSELKLISGGKRSTLRSRRSFRSKKHNLLTPHIWLPHVQGHGETARDRTATGKNRALLKVALEERLGTPMRIALEEWATSTEDIQCKFCLKTEAPILYKGPNGYVCADCFSDGLATIARGEPWPR
jgi:hypothetical protein